MGPCRLAADGLGKLGRLGSCLSKFLWLCETLLDLFRMLVICVEKQVEPFIHSLKGWSSFEPGEFES
jgi:hypothetical protein